MKIKNWKVLFELICLFGDAVLIFLSFYIVFQVRFYSPIVTNIIPPIKGIPCWDVYRQAIFFIIPLWILTFGWNKLYRLKKKFFVDEFLLVMKSTFISTLFTLFLCFFYRGYEFSRLVIVMSYFLITILIFLWHRVIKYTFRLVSSFFPLKNILVIGHAKNIRNIRHLLRSHLHSNVKFMPEFSLDKLKKYTNPQNVDEVIAMEQDFTNDMLIKLSDFCNSLNINFKIMPDIFHLRRGEIIIDEELDIPIYQIKPLSLYGMNFIIKRIFDVIVSIIVFSLLSPILLCIAFLIKLDSKGPVLYSHERKGLREKKFKFYKFRTMIENADEMLNDLLGKSDRKGDVFKMKNDPRITKIGKFLRKYSLDELPQLFNVLRGEMSLVGPRPQVIWETEKYPEYAKRRLNILPGLTGLWQISGRADLSAEKMFELDIYYIENWSIGFDIYILLKTIPAVLSKKGAY